jgi:putative transposase
MSTKKHEVPEALLTSLLADYKKPEDLIGENGLLKQLTKLLVEKALDAELAEHLGHGKNEGAVRVKAVYLAIGVTMAGEKEVLGLWLAQTEGAKFWLQVVTELRNRGVQDIFIACVDGLKGFPEAIEAVFPRAAVQLCIVHMVRNSLNYVSWKRRAEVAADLKRIYESATADEAEQRLEEFEIKWDDDYLPIGQSWRRN